MHALAAVQYLGDLGCEHIVLKNDEKTVSEIAALHPRGILVSPGPGEWLRPLPCMWIQGTLYICRRTCRH